MFCCMTNTAGLFYVLLPLWTNHQHKSHDTSLHPPPLPWFPSSSPGVGLVSDERVTGRLMGSVLLEPLLRKLMDSILLFLCVSFLLLFVVSF